MIVQLGVKCQSCSKFYPEHDIIRIGTSVTQCHKCYEKHIAALDVLAGKPPTACAECGTPAAVLAEHTPGDHVPMYLHAKDGCYQLLCGACDAVYVQKRRDLYGGTRFGQARGL